MAIMKKCSARNPRTKLLAELLNTFDIIDEEGTKQHQFMTEKYSRKHHEEDLTYEFCNEYVTILNSSQKKANKSNFNMYMNMSYILRRE
jgi:predicted HTH transcriptional regulator